MRYLVYILLLFISGCATTLEDAFNAADTAEQKAWAVKRSYEIYQEQALALILDERIPDSVKDGITRAVKIVKPAIDDVTEGIKLVSDVKAKFAQGQETSERLRVVADNLVSWAERAKSLVDSLATHLKTVRDGFSVLPDSRHNAELSNLNLILEG